MTRVGRNRRITDTSKDFVSSGLEFVKEKIPEHLTTDGAVVITCKDDAPGKLHFLANPPEKIIFRVDGEKETVCTRLENKAQWVTYLLEITGVSIYNVLFIFKEPCSKQTLLVERRGMPGYWQIIPIDWNRSSELGRTYNMDITLKPFTLIGFNLYVDFIG